MMKNRLILEINTENEEIITFCNFTSKIMKKITNSKNYILLSYDNFFKRYIPYDFRVENEQKTYFNSNLEKYTY